MIKSRIMKWIEQVANMEEKKKKYKILIGKPEGKILL